MEGLFALFSGRVSFAGSEASIRAALLGGTTVLVWRISNEIRRVDLRCSRQTRTSLPSQCQVRRVLLTVFVVAGSSRLRK